MTQCTVTVQYAIRYLEILAVRLLVKMLQSGMRVINTLYTITIIIRGKKTLCINWVGVEGPQGLGVVSGK